MVYYTYIGTCTIGGFTYGCKASLDDLKGYNTTFIDKFNKITFNLIVGTIYGSAIGVCAPISIPTCAIIAYNKITKIT